jgi:hypothetical protein
MLTEWVTEIGAWPGRKNDKVFQKALVDVAAHPGVEKVVSRFGDKSKSGIPLTPYFVANARRDAVEEAVGRMMSTTAQVWADAYCQPVSAVAIVEKHEEVERARSEGLTALSDVAPEDRDRLGFYLSLLDAGERRLAPLNDPIVERRPPTRKDLDGRPDAEYAHARAALARVRPAAREMFGKAGDHVARVFVSAASRIDFTPDDQRGRH